MLADVRVARHGHMAQIALLSFSWINPFGLEEYLADLFNIHALTAAHLAGEWTVPQAAARHFCILDLQWSDMVTHTKNFELKGFLPHWKHKDP